MKLRLKKYLLLLLLLAFLPGVALAGGNEPATVKQERNHVRSGNKLYNAKRYNEAEVEYRKALEANPRSAMAQFNLASALIREDAAGSQKQQQQSQQQQASKQQSEAVKLLTNLEKTCTSRDIASKASYDLGNILYKQKNYQEAIAHYKQALRKNPGYDNARYNLRMAQLKLKQQQQQNKNNKNGKNNKDKNNDKNKNKDQNKDQNKQNQDKKNQDKQNQNNQQNKQQQQQGGMSKENMDQILRTMQNQENATRQRAEQRRAQMQAGERARTQYKW